MSLRSLSPIEGLSRTRTALLAASYLARTKALSPKERAAATLRLLKRWMRGSPTEAQVAFGPRELVFEAFHYPDWRVYRSVFVEREYATDYAGAVVVDIGAHRGLSAAFALLKGCSWLFAYEPEPANDSFLQRNARAFEGPEQKTDVQQQAVGVENGTVTFYSYSESWSHSTSPRADKTPTGTHQVEQVAFDDVIAQAAAAAGPAAPVIVKLDAEGIEYDVLHAASPETLRAVSELFVEVHDYAPGTRASLEQHLSGSGMRLLSTRQSPGGRHHVLHFGRPPEGEAP